MRTTWRDGDRIRTVDIAPLGGGRWRVSVDGAEQEVEAEHLDGGMLRLRTTEGATLAEVTAAGERRFVRLGTLDFVLERAREGRRTRGSSQAAGLEAPMPGVVTRVLIAPGDEVRKGQPLIALEAMKMEHLIRAPRDGKVRAVAARAGEMVNGGVELVELEESG